MKTFKNLVIIIIALFLLSFKAGEINKSEIIKYMIENAAITHNKCNGQYKLRIKFSPNTYISIDMPVELKIDNCAVQRFNH